MIIPGWIDGYHARHGYRGEMTSQAASKGGRTTCTIRLIPIPVRTAASTIDRSPLVPAADPRWLKLGIATALGVAFLGALSIARTSETHRRLR